MVPYFKFSKFSVYFSFPSKLLPTSLFVLVAFVLQPGLFYFLSCLNEIADRINQFSFNLFHFLRFSDFRTKSELINQVHGQCKQTDSSEENYKNPTKPRQDSNCVCREGHFQGDCLLFIGNFDIAGVVLDGLVGQVDEMPEIP